MSMLMHWVMSLSGVQPNCLLWSGDRGNAEYMYVRKQLCCIYLVRRLGETLNEMKWLAQNRSEWRKLICVFASHGAESELWGWGRF